MKIFFLVLLFTMVISNITYALDPQLQKKYPFLLLSDDHGILKENDLSAFAKTMNYEKFSRKHSGLVYWQCFPREQISITLKDKGYTAEEFEPTDTMSDLTIVIHTQPDILHTYSMRRSYPISVYQDDFIK